MKIAESWLREWVDPDLDTDALSHQLTMLGLEVDDLSLEGQGIEDVLIAEVVECAKHPDADRLSVCKVSDGSDELIDIVCGAPNVRVGLKTPLAKPGVKLPNGLKLRKSKIRGVVSNGMLCSAVELGLGDESDGIMELPEDAPVGTPLNDYLHLPDAVIDVDLTPNRGDCFSILGIARDVAALTGASLKAAHFDVPAATIDDVYPVELVEPAGCPRFAGRVVRGVNLKARSPLWMVERLRRAGLREIHPVVDVTNYVMLELGQPLHAYDLAKLQGTIRPRLSLKGEKLTLLDEKAIELNEGSMVITDDSGVIGLAGIMGGLSTAVSDNTVDVFFEGAFWPQKFMAGQARSYGMHTDASVRFERGVDPEGQGRAVDRAVELLLSISGGDAGPLDVQSADEHVPQRTAIELRRARLAKLLGVTIADEEVTSILRRLELTVTETEAGWEAVAPSHRFDIRIEADLIEEVARIHGYDSIPETTAIAETPLARVTETLIDSDSAAATLVARDYYEAITYAFVDAESNRLFSGVDSEIVLANPISSEMSVMRSSLLPGLVAAAAGNTARQQERVRLFEIGKSFHGTLNEHEEVVEDCSGSLPATLRRSSGRARLRLVDFFDIKADVEALLAMAGQCCQGSFEAATHVALQPGQARISCVTAASSASLASCTQASQRHLISSAPCYVFELDALAAMRSAAPLATSVSKYPAIRRDIAVIVDDKVTADAVDCKLSKQRSGIDQKRQNF